MVFCLGPIGLHAQDTLQLKRVEIVEVRVAKELTGDFVQEFDLRDFASGAAQSPTDWLSRRSNLALRGYGPGSSIGLSIRGSSPAQSQVLINGLPFDNPSLAQADLSLLPPGLFSSLQLLRGGSGAYLGNAAIGGSLLLKTVVDPNSIGNVRLVAGSFGLLNLSAVANYRLGKSRHSTHIYRNHSDHNFERMDPLNRFETEAQPNAKATSKGFAQVSELNIGRQTMLHFLGWYGETDRQLPPNISKPQSAERQEDRTLRLQGGLRTTIRSLLLEGDMAFTHGALNYFHPEIGIKDFSEFTTLQGRLKISKEAKWGDLFTIINVQSSAAETAAYDRTQQRNSPSIVSGIRQDLWEKRFEYSASIRQEWLNGEALPLIPHLGLRLKLNDRFAIRSNLGRAYRLPGLNDLFWNPGGNPDLLPESGWFQEVGFTFAERRAQPRYELHITGFNRLIDNWIAWVPGPSYWSPVNFKQVHTSGVEATGSWSLERPTFDIVQTFETTYTVARNTATAGDEALSDGKQLLYTPIWSAYYAQRWSFWNDTFCPEIRGRYQSRRYTTADNSRWLEPFFTLDFTLSSELHAKRFPVAIYASLLNILNASYQVQASHPMPGRAFEIGLEFSLNHRTKKP